MKPRVRYVIVQLIRGPYSKSRGMTVRLSNRLARAALAATLVMACGDVLTPAFRVLRRELTPDDYAVYSAWLAASKPAADGTILVDATTTGAGYAGLSLLSPSIGLVPAVGCMPTSTGLVVCGPTTPVVREPDDEASQDLSVQRELNLPLER